jgi:hypothetical protein
MPTIVNGLAFGSLSFSAEFGEVGVFDLGWPGEVLEATFIAVERFFTGGFACEFLARGGEDGVVVVFFSLIPGSLSFFLLPLSIRHSPAFYLPSKG